MKCCLTNDSFSLMSTKMFLTVRVREWSLERFASSRRLYSKDASIETHIHTRLSLRCAFSLLATAKRCRRWLLTRRKRRWRRPRGGQRRTQASKEEEHARWAGRSGVALQTNNLGRLNPVKRRTFASSFLTFFTIVQLRSSSSFLAASFVDVDSAEDSATPGICTVMTFAWGIDESPKWS